MCATSIRLTLFNLIVLTGLLQTGLRVVLAQDEIAVNTDVKKLIFHSEILTQDRIVTIAVPRSFPDASLRYPLLIVLDGEDFFYPIASMVDYYTRIGRCPELLVAGINASDRWQDYTPTNATIPDGTPVPTSGKAGVFLEYIHGELIPFLESIYPLTPFRIIYGHSIAGLFVVNSMMTDESPFSTFIATSPSLWWDNELMQQKVVRFGETAHGNSRYLYLTMGNEGDTMLNPLLRFKQAVENARYKTIEMNFEHFVNIDHQTMPVKVFANALDYIFSDLILSEALYNQGLDSILTYYKQLSKKYRVLLEPPEKTLNRLGYIEMNKGNLNAAIQIFKFNVLKYPASANVYDSLGEALLKSGDKLNAMINYQKSLELNPENENARQVIDELRKLK